MDIISSKSVQEPEADQALVKRSGFDPVHVPRAHEMAVEHMLEAIERMGFRAGSRLPSEEELATVLSLSRPTIRAGLKVLKDSGYISIRRGNGGGIFLESDLLPLIVFPSYQYPESIREILVARRTIEIAITRLATEVATEKDFLEIERPIDLMFRHQHDFEAAMCADGMFHRAVYRAAHNRILERAIREVRRPLSAIRKKYATPRIESNVTVKLCMNQLDAMRRRDFEAVDRIVDEHLSILENDFTTKAETED